MVEVFKTDVQHPDHAGLLLEQIHSSFGQYQANFDLEDCDRILRVVCPGGKINPPLVIGLLDSFGFKAQVLPDEV